MEKSINVLRNIDIKSASLVSHAERTVDGAYERAGFTRWPYWPESCEDLRCQLCASRMYLARGPAQYTMPTTTCKTVFEPPKLPLSRCLSYYVALQESALRVYSSWPRSRPGLADTGQSRVAPQQRSGVSPRGGAESKQRRAPQTRRKFERARWRPKRTTPKRWRGGGGGLV